MPGCVYNREVNRVTLEALVSHINRDAALALFLEVVHYVRQLEATLASLLGFLAVFVDEVLLNRAGLQQEPTD